jgi:hypothetical protein
MELYKFREVNANNLSALANKQFWLSSLSQLNDPFEGSYIKDNKVSEAIIDDLVSMLKKDISDAKYNEALETFGVKNGELTKRDFAKKLAEHGLDDLLKIIHSSKVACFSLNEPSNDPILSNLMWSHYANGLRGFCLIFDGDLLQEEIYQSNEVMRPIKIEYKNVPNTLKLLDFIESGVFSRSNMEGIIQSVTKTIATKSIEWDYENEFRMVSLKESHFRNYSDNVLKSIVFGEKISSEHKKLLLDIVKANHSNVLIQEARLKLNSYSLEIVPYIDS